MIDYIIQEVRRCFEDRVSAEPTSGCWLWTGKLMNNGYGQFGFCGRKYTAHRFAWALYRGEPGDLCVLHRCDNRACVNPDHLLLGTHQDNTSDRVRKSRPGGRPRTSSAHLPRGVYPHARSLRFRAQVTSRGESIHLGMFDTPEEASAAVENELARLHG